MQLERIEITNKAEDDLASLPSEVEETYFRKVQEADKTLQLGAAPRQVFKGLVGNMHPFLQMTLGRDYRAWFLEGRHLELLEEDIIYGLKVLSKKEVKRLIRRIQNGLAYAQSVLG